MNNKSYISNNNLAQGYKGMKNDSNKSLMNLSESAYPISEWKFADTSADEMKRWGTPAREVNFTLLPRWRLAGYKTFLDLGTFLGRHAILAAEKGFQVSAMDMNKSNIDYVRKLADKKGLDIDLQASNMFNLPYPDKSFDCVLGMHIISLSDTNGTIRAIKEVGRVLDDNGEAYITLDSKNCPVFKNLFKRWRMTTRVDKNSRKVKDIGEMDSGTTHCFFDDKMISEIMAQCGLIVQDKKLVPVYKAHEKRQVLQTVHYHLILRKAHGK